MEGQYYTHSVRLYPSGAGVWSWWGISGCEFNQWANDASVNGKKLTLLLSPALPLTHLNFPPFLNNKIEPRAHHSSGNHTRLSIRAFFPLLRQESWSVCALIFLPCRPERWCSLVVLHLSDIPNPKLEETAKDTHACTRNWSEAQNKGIFMSRLPGVTELNLVVACDLGWRFYGHPNDSRMNWNLDN